MDDSEQDSNSSSGSIFGREEEQQSSDESDDYEENPKASDDEDYLHDCNMDRWDAHDLMRDEGASHVPNRVENFANEDPMSKVSLCR